MDIDFINGRFYYLLCCLTRNDEACFNISQFYFIGNVDHSSHSAETGTFNIKNMGSFSNVQLIGNCTGCRRFKTVLPNTTERKGTNLICRYVCIIQCFLSCNGSIFGQGMAFIPISSFLNAGQRFHMALLKPHGIKERGKFCFYFCGGDDIRGKFIPKWFYIYGWISHCCLQKDFSSFFVKPTIFIPMFLYKTILKSSENMWASAITYGSGP